MPSNPPTPLTPEQYLQTVISVVPASLAGPCGICREPYQAPVVLSCGHMFCRGCVMPWFGGGATTCPMDRKELFRCIQASNEEENGLDRTDLDGEAGLTPGPVQSATRVRARRAVGEVFLDGVLVACDGALDQYGCCLLIHDLWHHTARQLHSFAAFTGRDIGPEEAGDMDVELLRSCIQQAIHPGVRIGELAWGVLYMAARQMLVWHSVGWGGEGRWRVGSSEERPPGEEFEGMVEALIEACRAEGGR